MDTKKNIVKANIQSTRRNFLKVAATVAGTAALGSCAKPVEKAIPFVIQPENIEPGESQFYNTTFYNGDEWGLVKVRTVNGRPVKIEGNPDCPFSNGGTSAIMQATLPDLYDNTRFKTPLIQQQPAALSDFDEIVSKKLGEISNSQKPLAVIMPSLFSPSTAQVIELFTANFPGTRAFHYDKISYSAMLEAAEILFNEQSIPAFDFEKADVVIGFNSDFLGTWLDPVIFTRGYSQRKQNQQKRPVHVQLESGMSLTGTNADERIIIHPSQEFGLLAAIFNKLASLTGLANPVSAESTDENQNITGKLVQLLGQNTGSSLVISGTNRFEIQMLIFGINHLLGNFGKTIDFKQAYIHRQYHRNSISGLIDMIKSDEIAGIICIETNPVYDFQFDEDFVSAYKKLDFTLSLTDRPDETTALSGFICPTAHFLESWCDFEIRKGFYTWQQPVIQSLTGARQFQDSLLQWAGVNRKFQDIVEENGVLLVSGSRETNYQNLQLFKKQIEEKGFLLKDDAGEKAYKTPVFEINKFENLRNTTETGIVLKSCQSVNIGSGRFSANPWLRELPDPVTKICWDNYAAISASLASRFSLREGDCIMLNEKQEIPVFIQPGQEADTISVFIGYGTSQGKINGESIGFAVNAYYTSISELQKGLVLVTKIEKTGERHNFAFAQKHHSQEGRNLARYADEGNGENSKSETSPEDLYPAYNYPGNKWGMVVDLDACTGCNACVVACQAENNIPVVGKAEVEKGRIMHWIKIDRYYDGDPENPQTIRQPVMCQHCGNAPCENVCPVAATNHSTEGINQMVYNRCVGTRYCNNNCPYNVRVFNWRNYTGAGFFPRKIYDPAGMTAGLRRMLLNPDVTVRSNGVIEKCSFCIQRIQGAKIKAKKENRPLADGEFTTACEQACAAGAIVFGNLNNPESLVNRLKNQERAYSLLGGLNTKPSVTYLGKTKPQNPIIAKDEKS